MRKLLILFVIFISLPAFPISKLSENELKKYTSRIIEKMIQDNPDQEDAIYTDCKGYLKKGKATVRLSTRLGLFYYQMTKKNIHLKKTRFYSNNDDFTIVLIMDDQVEKKNYLIFLEYTHTKSMCILKDIYVANIYDESVIEMRAFFDNR